MTPLELRNLLAADLSTHLGQYRNRRTQALQPAIWVGDPPKDLEMLTTGVALECIIEPIPESRNAPHLEGQSEAGEIYTVYLRCWASTAVALDNFAKARSALKGAVTLEDERPPKRPVEPGAPWEQEFQVSR